MTLSFASAREGASFLSDTAGHVLSEQDRLERLGTCADLHRQLTNFVHARAEMSENGIALNLDYLLATAIKG